jgi:hypothetical protein
VSSFRLKRALKKMRALHPEITLMSLPASHIVTDGRDIYLRTESASLERIIDGQLEFAFVVELKTLRREVANRISDVLSETADSSKLKVQGARRRR